MKGSSTRPLRADAARNRAAVLAAARTAYTSAGDDTSIEAIARAAGVGVGTIYRQFTSREGLVEAVYAAELADVTARADTLLDGGDRPARALRTWMDSYAAFVASKHGMIDVLRSAWGSGVLAPPTTRATITATVERFLQRGRQDGSLRADLSADDVTSALVGVCIAAADGDQLARLLDLLLDGLRTTEDS